MKQKKRDFTIRAMTKDDLDTIYALEKLATEIPWTEGIIEDCIDVNYHCLVMERAGEVLAYVIASIEGVECHIFNITVNPEFHRQGYGRQLLDYVRKRVRKKGCNVILLEVRVSNQPAIKFYTRLNFKKVTIRKDYYDDDGKIEDAVMFRLDFP